MLLRTKQYGVDYGPLKGSFTNPKIAPSDIDGIVERNNNFLIFECKHEHDNELSAGQLFTLQGLARQPNTTVLEVMLSGKRTEAGALLFEPLKIRRIGGQSLADWEDTNINDFRERCHRWSHYVDRIIK